MTQAHENSPDAHHDDYSKTVFGFWIYLLTDFMLFATIFAAYAVLSKSTFGGLSGRELFDIHYTFNQTLILLFSSVTAGFAGAFAHRKNKRGTIAFFIVTFVLGIAFMWMMFGEFSHLSSLGYTWKTNAFFSIFYTLVGILGLHVLFALLWVIVLIPPIFCNGITPISLKRLTCLRMFWQFINIIWVFIFTIVYLLGVI